MATLPEDLIIDILLRLPYDVKLIAQWNCVSKTWQSLLSGAHEFAKINLDVHIHDSVFFLHGDGEPYVATLSTETGVIATKKVEFPHGFSGALVEASSHGLILVRLNHHSLVLLNPITQETVDIKPYWNKHSCCHGLGYDSGTDDFKVVSIRKDVIYIYSVKTKTYRTLLNSSPFSYGNTGVFVVNGRMHFIDELTFVIAAFNLGSEEFESVPYPQGFGGFRPRVDELSVIGGCLAMVVPCSDTSFDVWLMKEYGVQDSWTKFTVHAPDDANESWIKYCFPDMKPVCFLGEDEIVLVGDSRTRFVGYNWRSGVWRDMVVDGSSNLFWSRSGIISFREMPISPNYKYIKANARNPKCK